MQNSWQFSHQHFDEQNFMSDGWKTLVVSCAIDCCCISFSADFQEEPQKRQVHRSASCDQYLALQFRFSKEPKKIVDAVHDETLRNPYIVL